MLCSGIIGDIAKAFGDVAGRYLRPCSDIAGDVAQAFGNAARRYLGQCSDIAGDIAKAFGDVAGDVSGVPVASLATSLNLP